MVPCFHCPPSSCCTVTVDSVHRKGIFLWVSTSSLVWTVCLLFAEWVLSSLSYPMVSLLNLSSMSLDGLLNRSMAQLSNPGFNSVYLMYLIYNFMYISISFISFSWFSINFMHASACLLFWWLYNDNTAWFMLSHFWGPQILWNKSLCPHLKLFYWTTCILKI